VLRKVKRQTKEEAEIDQNRTKIARFTRLSSTSGAIERKSVSVETRWDRTRRVRASALARASFWPHKARVFKPLLGALFFLQ
jgi:hypothetical protein